MDRYKYENDTVASLSGEWALFADFVRDAFKIPEARRLAAEDLECDHRIPGALRDYARNFIARWNEAENSADVAACRKAYAQAQFDLTDTGGGCRAYVRPIYLNTLTVDGEPTQIGTIVVTYANDCDIPRGTGDPVMACLYVHDGDDWSEAQVSKEWHFANTDAFIRAWPTILTAARVFAIAAHDLANTLS